MRAALGLVLVAACSPSPPAGAPCGANGECPDTLECAPATNTCEIPGAAPGVDGPPADMPIDMPPDGPSVLCAGTFQMFCVDAPTGAVVFSGASTIDTDDPTACATYTGPTGYCVVAATAISVAGTATVTATGSKPLVLLAETITIDGIVDVGSTSLRTGAAANSTDCIAAAAPTLENGGPGGSFGGQGGAGSSGAQAPAATPPAPTTLRGGCRGTNGAASTGTFGIGGASGGALGVLASDAVIISGTLRAGGAGGSGGSATAGGGGGGTGGMIVVEGSSIDNTGAIRANGGGGGGGGVGAASGEDATGAAAAQGGLGTGTSTTGNGGAGSVNATLTGTQGVNGAPDSDGGGGGGAGVIKLIAPMLAAGTTSPPPT